MATQDAPIQSGSDDADDAGRIDGIIEQCRVDLSVAENPDPAAMLRQRLDQAGVVVTDAEFDTALARLTS
jgi:hypothetical protein